MPQTFPDRKKWPQRKRLSRSLFKWIWQLWLRKDVCPCLWMCPFPPFTIPRTRVTFTVCLTVWLGSWRSCVPQAVGMGEKQIHQACYSQGGWVFSITFPLSCLKFNTPMMEISPFISVEVWSASKPPHIFSHEPSSGWRNKNVKSILLVFSLQSEINW